MRIKKTTITSIQVVAVAVGRVFVVVVVGRVENHFGNWFDRLALHFDNYSAYGRGLDRFGREDGHFGMGVVHFDKPTASWFDLADKWFDYRQQYLEGNR